jgi:hypothetical protein
MAFKKGDHVRVVRNEFGHTEGPYSPGTTGVITGFRTNRFYGRQAIVQLDGLEEDDPMGAFVDWTLSDIEKVEE